TQQKQKIIIPNKHGENLVGLLHDTGSKELVILCHGFRSTKETSTIVNVAVALENEGISAFRFDFAGNGESEGSFEYGHYFREADDLHAVIQHFVGRNRVISAILGHSKGGNVVLLYASKYKDVSAVVNVSGRYALEKGIEERLGKNFLQIINEVGFIDVMSKSGKVDYRVTKESLLDRLNTNMHEACLKIDGKCRVLTIHGSADEVIPVEDALTFSKIIPNHKLHIVEGADHCYTSHQIELASDALRFIKECVQQDRNNTSEVPLYPVEIGDLLRCLIIRYGKEELQMPPVTVTAANKPDLTLKFNVLRNHRSSFLRCIFDDDGDGDDDDDEMVMVMMMMMKLK
ncbi:Serine aminopeptidase, S33, partial [Dillenia turbinata]